MSKYRCGKTTEIRGQYLGGTKLKDLLKRYGPAVTATISNIVAGRTWKSTPLEKSAP